MTDRRLTCHVVSTAAVNKQDRTGTRPHFHQQGSTHFFQLPQTAPPAGDQTDTGQTRESMGTLDTQCDPNRLTYHVSICSEMEAQHLLNFSSNGLLHCCCHLQKLPWCVRTCLLPCSFRYINHGMPAKAHGYVLKVGSAVMSRRSVVASRSPEWAHMKRLLADRIFCQHFKDLPAQPPPPGMTVFRLIKVHLQVFCA